MRMDRVLHINDYPIETGGGAEVVMRTTLTLLRARGIAVETFTSADLADARQTPFSYVNNRRAQKSLALKLQAFRPDVVHLHNFYHVLSPGILATLAEYQRWYPVRVVMTAHDYHLVCPNSGGSWFRWWTGARESIGPGAASMVSLLMRKWDQRSCPHSLLKLAQHLWNYRWHHRQSVIDRVICPSRFVQGMLAPLGLTTRWLPHPVPQLPTSASAREGPLRFVFAGRLEPEKGLNEFLRSWPTNYPATLAIIGTGSERARCQETCAVQHLTGRVEFLGRRSHAETLARIARCHVLIQPSRVLETYGLTLIEALAHGTNVLAANRGAAREIIEAAEVGFLYEPSEPSSLIAQLEEIRQRHEAGTLNRFEIGAFLAERSEQRYIDQLLQIYKTPKLALPVAA
jgi:glycosyltransferase involved in cell wall biosynthesis